MNRHTAPRHALRSGFTLLLALAGCAGPPTALPTSVPTGTRATARFTDARAVAADAAGRLYVADAGAARILVFAPDGRAEAAIGGPGTSDESLAEPVDVDPTNGQAVYVADAATGRVVRFTAERRAAEAIPVPDGTAALDARTDAPRGRPVAVAAGAGTDLFVAEARRGLVLVLDAARRVERTVGRAPFRALTGMASDARGRVAVLDGGAVHTFDAFGAPGPDLDARAAGVARSVSVARSGSSGLVLVAGDAGVALFRDGAPAGVVPSAVALVDATVAGGRLWGLGRYGLVDLGPVPDAG